MARPSSSGHGHGHHHKASVAGPGRHDSAPSSPASSRSASKSKHNESVSSAGSVHLASPLKRFHHPSRWSEWAIDKSKMVTGRGTGNGDDDFGAEVGGTARLLEALGMSPGPSPEKRETVQPRKKNQQLPEFAPPDLEHCVDDCYWRWLVKTLLDEVAALKYSLKEAQEEFEKRVEQKRKIEERNGYRDYVLDDIMSMRNSMRKLDLEVPKLRIDHGKLQAQADNLDNKRRIHETKQDELRAAIGHIVRWQETNTRKLNIVEQDCEDGQEQEQALIDKLQAMRDDMEREEEEIQRLTSERDSMRTEVKALEEAKKSKKKSAKQKK